MLSLLTIRDLALVDRVELPFGPGLNVLTGETGAGKSVLVGALSIVLGGRASSDAVREGAREAVVEALFDVTPGGQLAARLEAQGIDVGDGQLLVRRSLARGGRGRVHLNGQLATVSMLGRLLDGVVELTGQHEHVALLDPGRHLELLDGFGGHAALCARVEEAHERVVHLREDLARLERAARDGAQRQDYLRFALDEIAAVDPQPDELEGLEVERRRLRAVAELMEGAGRAEGALDAEEGSVLDAVGRVQATLERLAALDPTVEALVSKAIEVDAGLEELAQAIGRYREGLEADPERLTEVEDRVEALRRLCRKYGGSEEAVLRTRAQMEVELDTVENRDAHLAERGRAVAEAERVRLEAAGALTKARKAAARRLCAAVSDELEALSMVGTRVDLELTPLPEPGPRGGEGVELRFAPNRGEPLRALRKSASGGELSRVLLAIKNVLAHRGEATCHVFDEVDTGIGGGVAEVIGAKLKSVAAGAQVVAVTHLPQVAAYADHHIQVRKEVLDGRTLTRVELLSEEARVEELARMVGGLEITPRTRGLARELRDRGRSPRDAGPAGSGARHDKGRARAKRRARSARVAS